MPLPEAPLTDIQSQFLSQDRICQGFWTVGLLFQALRYALCYHISVPYSVPQRFTISGAFSLTMPPVAHAQCNQRRYTCAYCFFQRLPMASACAQSPPYLLATRVLACPTLLCFLHSRFTAVPTPAAQASHARACQAAPRRARRQSRQRQSTLECRGSLGVHTRTAQDH